jgi:V8-like Glu-specific endopeptidase
MGIPVRFLRGRVAAIGVTLAAGVLAAGGASAGAAAATRAGAGAAGTGAATGSAGAGGAVVHAVSQAGQSATRAFWTRSRMAAATPVAGERAATAPASQPSSIPDPTQFAGVPTVGALFFTTGTQVHFCTASVVDSFTANLVLTAAHCVYGSTYATNIEFVPEYHAGKQPFGGWPVATITVAAGWQQSHDQNLDFAFLSVTPPAGTQLPIQAVTGGLWLGINRGYAHPIEVIGYNNTGDAPIKCATHSVRFSPTQMKFWCHNYQNGTSGGPWITGFDSASGAGTVFGVIGGYQEGGNYPWASYSAYFGLPTLELFLQAEKQQA